MTQPRNVLFRPSLCVERARPEISNSVLYMKLIAFLHVVINFVLGENEFEVSFIMSWSRHKENLIAKQIRNYILISRLSLA